MPFPEYERFPSKNRRPTGIEFPWIEIEDATFKAFKTDPNALVGCVIWGASGEQPTDRNGNAIEAFDNGAVVFNPLELVPRENVPSVLSGEPSVAFRHDDIVVDLTPEELLRFISRSLRVDEFMALREHFGMFFDIHADFYDQRTGHSYNTMASLIGNNPPPALRRPPVM